MALRFRRIRWSVAQSFPESHQTLPFIQLVRPTFSLVTVPTPRGGTRTDFGDIQLFDLAVLPWPRAETGLRFGLGRHSCSRPRPRSSLVKARGRRVPPVLQFIPA